MRDDIAFHSKRALAEIDLARHTADSRAARAHLVAEQHLERMRELSGRSEAAE